MVGTMLGAISGHYLNTVVDAFVRSPQGRLFLTRLGQQSPKQAAIAMQNLLDTPELLSVWASGDHQ
jgi:hypothetical protein